MYPKGEKMKKWWQSKTLWVNSILAIAVFYPPAREKLTPELLSQILIGANIILRFLTKDKLFLTE